MLLAAACNGDNHLLTGQQYIASNKCLNPEQAIDDVAGPDPGQSCSPTCLVAASPDGGEIVFITTTCGPYPSYFTSESQDAATSKTDECGAAFAAYARAVECGPDGTAPEAGADATNDADAGSDSESGSDSASGSDSGSDSASDSGSGSGSDSGSDSTSRSDSALVSDSPTGS